jgi:hypothetical protein
VLNNIALQILKHILNTSSSLCLGPVEEFNAARLSNVLKCVLRIDQKRQPATRLTTTLLYSKLLRLEELWTSNPLEAS